MCGNIYIHTVQLMYNKICRRCDQLAGNRDAVSQYSPADWNVSQQTAFMYCVV